MNANRMREYFRERQVEHARKPTGGKLLVGTPVGGKWLVGTDLVHRTRAAVTCLLHDDGGWWSPSCVRSRAGMPPIMNTLLARCLVRAALAELARDGRVEVGYVGPASEPLFRWVR